MTLNDDLDIIEKQLVAYADEEKRIAEQESIINIRIAELRMELANLRESSRVIKQKARKDQSERESLIRKIDLERETAEIEKSLAEKRVRALELIKCAPWRDVAFGWQIDGAIQLPERALLGDKRGLGKTLSALIWLTVQEAKKVLICVRREVASEFIKEIGIREPNTFVYPLLGATSETREHAAMLLDYQEKFVVVTNIESWRRDIDKTTKDILRIKYDAVVLDEAHHIHNIGTGTAQGFLKLAESIPKVLELTGTPIKNRPQEMFTLLHALYPHLFRTEREFLRDYCRQISQNRWTFTEYGLTQLIKKIKPFFIARDREDVGVEIPPPNMIEYKLNLNSHPLQREAYKLMAERSAAQLLTGKVIPIMSQLAIMTRLAQMTSWPAGIRFVDPETEEVIKFDVHESVKMDWAEDLIQELVGEGERVVLFSRFKPAIYELKARLDKIPNGPRVAVITGDEKRVGNTEEIFNDFDLKTASSDNYKFDILLATYQTIGESANLNAARHMILYDRYWNPGNDDQAIGRIDRINSIDQATVHLPSVDNTFDDYMIELITGKRNIVTEFKDAASMQKSLAEHLSRSL